MSVQENDVLAENLFEQLEALEPVMNFHEYVDKQQTLLRMLSKGDFDGARELVGQACASYGMDAGIAVHRDQIDMADEVTDVY